MVSHHAGTSLRKGPLATPSAHRPVEPPSRINPTAPHPPSRTDFSPYVRPMSQVCCLLGEPDAKEPEEVFDTLEKFLMRYEAADREMDEARKAAEEQRLKASASAARRATPGSAKKKELKSRPSIVPGMPRLSIGIRRSNKAAPPPAAPGGGDAAAACASQPVDIGDGGVVDERAAGGAMGGALGGLGAAIPQRRLSSNASSGKRDVLGGSVGSLTQEMKLSFGKPKK